MTEQADSDARTILVVDDQEDLLFMLSVALENAGYAVLQATSGEEAVRLAMESSRPIDLLLTDVVMPGMNGREVAEALQVRNAQMQVIFMSGFDYQILFPKRESDPSVTFIAKPFTVTTLVQRVRQLLEQPQGVES